MVRNPEHKAHERQDALGPWRSPDTKTDDTDLRPGKSYSPWLLVPVYPRCPDLSTPGCRPISRSVVKLPECRPVFAFFSVPSYNASCSQKEVLWEPSIRGPFSNRGSERTALASPLGGKGDEEEVPCRAAGPTTEGGKIEGSADASRALPQPVSSPPEKQRTAQNRRVTGGTKGTRRGDNQQVRSCTLWVAGR